MKVTRNWLKEYVDFDWSADELGERLTMIGIEVEGIESLGGDFEGVVVAEILASEKHPNADRLSVCRVTDGQQERQIVCGATNFQTGDKVPLAKPGCALPAAPGEKPFVIKATKMRGVESQGMLCSAKELRVAEDAEGLLILPKDAPVGRPFAEHLGRAGSDVLYDLEITPNRPDLNSVIGIAREISALTGNPLQWPAVPEPVLKTGTIHHWVQIRIDDPDLCPRYTARVLRGVKVGPSPDWLKQTLETVGLRSINNVVDVTNYVMLETGQPLHAFDYHLLSPKPDQSEGLPTIVVRRAHQGEQFTTLDEQNHVLTDQMLLIADETKAVALAGVMGGRNSEINERTTDVLLESAYFKPQNIRATSKRLDLRTDASYRFERGADVGICDWASQRAAHLIQEVAGGEWVPGVADAWPQPASPGRVTVRYAKTRQLLGVDVPSEQQQDLLNRLGLPTIEQKPEVSCTVEIPTFRVDLKREVDLIEEIARVYGVDRIPSTAPRGLVGSHAYDPVHDQLWEARQLLAGLGLNEAQGQTLVAGEKARLTLPQIESSDGRGRALIALANPLSSDMDALRPSLLPGLVDALHHNLTHKIGDVALFEIGRVFFRAEGKLQEERRLAFALTGRRSPSFWQGTDRDAKLDIFDLKGLLDEFLDHYGVRGIRYNRRPERTDLFVESAEVQLGKSPLGEIGQLLPPLAKRYDLRDPVYLAELNLDRILSQRTTTKTFKSLPAYPSIRRDVAMVVPESTTHNAVLEAIKQARAPNLQSVELFDVFRGKNIPEGRKSLAYSLTYRNPDRTLTDAEVNTAHEKVLAQLRQSLQANIRDT